jgi:hypothetical protein
MGNPGDHDRPVRQAEYFAVGQIDQASIPARIVRPVKRRHPPATIRILSTLKKYWSRGPRLRSAFVPHRHDMPISISPRGNRIPRLLQSCYECCARSTPRVNPTIAKRSVLGFFWDFMRNTRAHGDHLAVKYDRVVVVLITSPGKKGPLGDPRGPL